MQSAFTSASLGASSMPRQSTRTCSRLDEVAQGLDHAGPVDLVLAGARREIGGERLEGDAAPAVTVVGGSSSSMRKRAIADERDEIAPVPGLGELRDAAGAADPVEFRHGGVAIVVGVGLDHADDAVAFQRLIHHRQIARLEDVQRHLAARKQQRAGQGKDRDDRRGNPPALGIPRSFPSKSPTAL